MDRDALRHWFAPDGPLSRALPAYEQHAEQMAMMEAVAGTLEEGGVLIVEAGTGTGKTLAYLAPSIACGQQVIVSTGTRTLQRQLIDRDLPFLRAHLPVKFRAVSLEGRGNYLCLHRLALRTEAETLFDSGAKLLARLVDWAERTSTGERAELTDLPEPLPLWFEVNSSSESCLGSSCARYEDCFVTRARRRAMTADIVVVNHHLYFADLAVRERWDGELLPRAAAVIFDEAHQLEDVACSFFGAVVGSGSLPELAAELEKAAPASGDDKSLARQLDRLRESGESFFAEFRAFPAGRTRLREGDLPPGSQSAWFAVDNELVVLATRFSRLGEKDENLLTIVRQIEDLRTRLQAVMELGSPGTVHWVERRERSVVLRMSPIDAAPILRERLLPSAPSLVFTSATLSTGDGDFSFQRRRLGLDGELRELALRSGFDFARQALLYVPTSLPEPRAPDFLAAACDEMERLLAATQGRAFLLFTSYANLNAAHARLARRLPYTVLKQGERPRDVLLEAFRRDRSSVLFATSSFWEGVDVVGEALSCVIIDKLPFGSPDDPLLQARLESLTEAGGKPFFDYQVPSAVIALRQGFGRLIRSRGDRGVVAVLDNRLHTKGYGRRFLAALPPCERTSHFSRVEDWCRENLPRAAPELPF